MDLSGRARELRALHVPGDPLIVVNAWDAASARVVAATPGCRAVASASWAVAAAQGVRDGALGADLMLAAVGRMAAAVDLPVTADLEAGYENAGETVARAIALGVVGANLEDRLDPLDDAVGRIEAARAAADAAGVPFVINARTDAFSRPFEGDRRAEAIQRGRAFVEAGADCVFAIGTGEPGDIRAVVEGVGAPVSVLARPGGPSLRELAALGVARISFGPGPFGGALAALFRTAEALHALGEIPADLAFRP